MKNLPFSEFDLLKKEDGTSGLTVREFDIIYQLHKKALDITAEKIAKLIMSPVDNVKNDIKDLLAKKLLIKTSRNTFLCSKRADLLVYTLEYYNKYAELLILEESSNRDIVDEYRRRFSD